MNIKRLLTGIIGFAIVLPFLIFGNKYLFDITMTIVAIISIYEFFKSARNAEINVVSWLGYVSCLLIAIVHIFPIKIIGIISFIWFPLVIFILFSYCIFSNMKINFKDIAITFFGIIYIVGCILSLVLLYGSDMLVWNLNGKILIWLLLFGAWGTDTCAYIFGKSFGKHKFSQVSPNKTIEGCLGGALGATLGGLIFTYAINNLLGCTMPYIYAAIILVLFSSVGQIGDFAASVIKRYFNVKDFSELFPGHGGMIDRIDSILFIAPFAYIIFTILTIFI